MKKVMVLGAYGNFGQRIVRALVKKQIFVILAGRNRVLLEALASKLKAQSQRLISCVEADVSKSIERLLVEERPFIVINTCGPFQKSDYSIAKQCISHGIHYIDLADGRDFVANICLLDVEAKRKDVAVISGASTVPALSSAVLDEYIKLFTSVHSVRYGISPGQKTSRGLATTKAILSYVGKPFHKMKGSCDVRYGWQNLYCQSYPELGKRWMANCEIPDLDLFPKRYAIKCIEFSAGVESTTLHFSLWLLSWLIRLGMPLNLPKYAGILLKISHWFDQFGTEDGGMHMLISGQTQTGQYKQIKWFIIAKKGDGPQIPAIPAVLLAEKILLGEFTKRGAFPCVGLISLSEYLKELIAFDIQTYCDFTPIM